MDIILCVIRTMVNKKTMSITGPLKTISKILDIDPIEFIVFLRLYDTHYKDDNLPIKIVYSKDNAINVSIKDELRKMPITHLRNIVDTCYEVIKLWKETEIDYDINIKFKSYRLI